MSSEGSLLLKPPELRIVLIGKVGGGKTSVLNTLLRSSEEDAPESQKILVPHTEKCRRETMRIRGQVVVVVDTPGLCSTDRTDEETLKELERSLSDAAPGPHVFLFVLSLDSFTQEDQETVKNIKETFGKKAERYTMALFTRGDQLKRHGMSIEEFIGESSDLRSFVDECEGGRCVIDNKHQSPAEVTELLQKINAVVQKNGGDFYTRDVKQEAKAEDKRAAVRRRIAMSVNGSAVAGAGLGGAVSHFTGSSVGIVAGAAAGAAVGGVMGGVGIVAAEHMKAKGCVLQ